MLMLCPRCKQPMQRVFEVKDVVVLIEPSTMLENLMGAKRKKHRRENPKARPLNLPLEKPKPPKVREAKLPYVALYYCHQCLTFYKGFSFYFEGRLTSLPAYDLL